MSARGTVPRSTTARSAVKRKVPAATGTTPSNVSALLQTLTPLAPTTLRTLRSHVPTL